MENNSNNSNTFWTLVAAGAGVALGFWLNSDKGRVWRKETTAKANEWGSTINQQTAEQYERAKETVNQTIEQTKETAAKFSEKIKGTIDSYASAAEEQVEKTETAFQKGASKAKAKLNSKEELLDSKA